MDMQYQPPAQEQIECNVLEDNFLTCLKDKYLKDDIPEMKCKPQQILWFNVQCPDRFAEYRDPLKLRNIFAQIKNGKGVDRPAYVRL